MLERLIENIELEIKRINAPQDKNLPSLWKLARKLCANLVLLDLGISCG